MVKLKKMMTKAETQSWQLYIDSTTTVKKDTDPRDSSGGTLSSEDRDVLARVVRHPDVSDPNKETINPGAMGWDREYINDNSVIFIHYFDTVENATAYYRKMINAAIDHSMDNRIKPNPKYRVIWYLCDESDNVIPFT
jgi:hypothetical protein